MSIVIAGCHIIFNVTIIITWWRFATRMLIFSGIPPLQLVNLVYLNQFLVFWGIAYIIYA